MSAPPPNTSNVLLLPNSFYVSGMSCSSCVSKITTAINTSPLPSGARAEITVSLVTAQASVKLSNGTTPSQEVLKEVKSVVTGLGFGVTEGEEGGGVDEFVAWRNKFIFSTIFTLPLVIIHYTMMYKHHKEMSKSNVDMDDVEVAPPSNWAYVLMFLLASPVQGVVGYPFLKKAYLHLKLTKSAGMDALVSLGTWSSYLYSVICLIFNIIQGQGGLWGEVRMQPTFETGVMLLTFVTGGKMMEAYAKGRTGDALKGLMELRVEEVRLDEE